MANEVIKIIEANGGVDLQAALDAWIATLVAGYVINSMEISQAGASLSSNRVIMAISYIDGTA